MSNVLVAYFSASGVTKGVAEKIADENGYDIFEIVPEEIYTPADLDWTDKNSRSTIEMNDKSVWWYTAPSIINTFIENVDLTGKTIKAFCTSGGSGIDKCVSDLQASYPELNFSKGMRFMGDVSKAKEWIENE